MAAGGIAQVQVGTSLALHVSNLPVGAAENDVLQMFLENATQDLELTEDGRVEEFSDSLEEALVIFENLTVGSEEVITRITGKQLLGKVLTAEEAPPNNRVFVTNISPKADEYTVTLYFEQTKFNSSKEEVVVEFDANNRVAIVTFSDPVLESVWTEDHSEILGTGVVVKHCNFFDHLGSFVQNDSGDAVDTEAGNEGIHPDESVTEEAVGETGSLNVNINSSVRGCGRGSRRGNQRSGRRSGRRGRGFHPDGGYRRQVSDLETASLDGSEHGEVSTGNERRPFRGANRFPGRRGRGAGSDHFVSQRPFSGSDRGRSERERRHRSESADISLAGSGPHPEQGRGDRGTNLVEGGTSRGRFQRRGEWFTNRGQQRDGQLGNRTGSVPSLLDKNLSLAPGMIHKEVDVKNEVGNEKCALLTTMIREIKSHGCNVYIDMRRHKVVIDGLEAAVSGATEALYTKMCSMHSVALEVPARFAQLLTTSRGHHWVVDFFKNSNLQAIYYTDAGENPRIIAADEFAAKSAEVLLTRKIKTVEIPYSNSQKTYLGSDEWSRFLASAEKTWLLVIEVLLTNIIRIVGSEDDVVPAVNNINSQLSSHARAPKPPNRAQQTARVPQVKPSKSAEPVTLCPVCGILFPQSDIASHVNLCSSKRICPICSMVCPAGISDEDFVLHVDQHF